MNTELLSAPALPTFDPAHGDEAVKAPLMSIAEFESWMVANGPAELVDGILHPLPMNNPLHSYTVYNVARPLGDWARQTKLGRVFAGDLGVYVKANTGRAMDVAYISHERMQEVTESMLRVPPELAVEVVSPSNLFDDLLDKIDEYFAFGVQLVWLVSPSKKRVFVYTSPRDVQVLEAARNDTLGGGEVLPGFSVAVADLFE